MATTQFPKQVSARSLQKNSEPKYKNDLQNNLKWAQLALQYVSKAMTVGAENKLSDELSSGGGALLCVAAMRKEENNIAGTDKHIIYWIAEMAKSTGCGNCGEQSAIAFEYLDENGIRPLDWMSRKNGDHAFVVIGRSKDSDPEKYATWGNVAVVCDPWMGASYPALEIAKRTSAKWVYSSMFRAP